MVLIYFTNTSVLLIQEQFVALHMLVLILIADVSSTVYSFVHHMLCIIALCNPECSNGGQCYHNSARNENYCVCPSGFRGKGCQQGIDYIL